MKNKREKISSEYSEAVKGNKKGVVYATGKAKYADYSDNELISLPEGISEHSFGCGNPVASSGMKSGQVILDLGCGAGLDLLLAAEKVGAEGKVIGVDMNNDMLNKAKDNIDASDFRNIELKKGAIEALPIESNSVDWVISNCVINLSLDKKQAFSEIARILKPGGQMLVSDIVAENLPWWARKSGALTAACAGGTISEKEYLQGLKEAGISQSSIVARQYYEPSQLASIVAASLPKRVIQLSCCGKSIAMRLLTKLVTPISRNLWSAKISGVLSSPGSA